MPPLFKYDDYDQCRAIYKRNFTYCVVDVQLFEGSNSSLWRQIEDFSRDRRCHFRHDKIKRGICLNEHLDVGFKGTFVNKMMRNRTKNEEKLVQKVIFDDLLASYGLKSDQKVKFCMTDETEKARMSFDLFDILFTFIIVSILTIIIVGTVSKNIQTTKTALKYFQIFSLPHNVKRLFENRSSETAFIDAIRVNAEQIVILVHIRVLFAEIGMENPLTMECEAHQPYTSVFASFVILLQNFFLLSGFLSFYKNAKKIIVDQKSLTKMDFLEMIVKRVVRLLPLMTLMMFFNATLATKISSGPILNDILDQEKEFCRKNWWTNILFLNNLLRSDEPCLQQTWHVAVEMQMFVMELLVLIIINKWKNLSSLVLTSTFVLTNIFQVLFLYGNGLIGIYLADLDAQRTTFRFEENYQKMHINPLTNTNGYVIGMIVAYVQLKLIKNGKNLNENWVFKKWNSIFLISFVPVGFYSYVMYFHRIQHPSIVFPILSTLSRNLCVLPAATVILQMFNSSKTDENPGVMKLFNDCYIFKPLSKINYGIYIVHVPVLLFVIAATTSSLVKYGSMVDILMHLYPFAVLATTLTAAICFVTFEMPTISAFKLLYYSTSKKEV
ncbi:nose resistant to fluoxetine protein 6-like [Culicoides brevitarsis]|uniref:nose resistant to fluoxetine protein 6-like n=1 Tax=Culicoides brevitarsis TaxID=469753 RepID=UPI00307C6FA1